MNRREMIERLTAVEALATAMRNALKAEAAGEFEGNGMAPSWKTPDGISVVASTTSDRCEVADQDDFMAWLVENMPQLVHTIVVPRDPKVVAAFLATVAESGPRPDPDSGERPTLAPGGTAQNAADIPGVMFVKGGTFKTITVTVPHAAKRRLADAAVALLAGDTAALSDVTSMFEPTYEA